MALEYELKYLAPNLVDLRKRLEAIGAECVAPPYFEENLIFDDENRSLRQQDILLRLRQKSGRDAVLTVKRPPSKPIDTALKVYEELETKASDFDATRMVLETLGHVVAFRYEKVREKWRLHGVDICLDQLPFGDFVELEGPEENLFQVARETGLDALATSKATYHALNREYRQQEGLEADENFMFSKPRRKALLQGL